MYTGLFQHGQPAETKRKIMGKIIRKTLEEIMKTPDRTDWEKFDSITDEELDEMVRNDPDDVYLTDEDFKSGKWVRRYTEPKKKSRLPSASTKTFWLSSARKGRGTRAELIMHCGHL